MPLFGLYYWLGPSIGAPDYPKDWPSPRLWVGSIGGCPDLSGSYDGVSDTVPRLLLGGPAWIQGGRGWYEHKATITQADDGNTLYITYALNERGLPEHRLHAMTYNRGWPSGGRIELKRDVAFRCGGRWLKVVSDERTFVSRDRDGNLIIGATRPVDERWSLGNLTFGSEFVDRTKWYRWTKRPAGADALLNNAYSFEINRFPWLNNRDTEVVVQLGNYQGTAQCVRVWNPDMRGSADASANARIASGHIYQSEECPSPWLRLPNLASENFTLLTKGVRYRVAYHPAGQPGAAVTSIDIARPLNLPLMPDQDEARRKRLQANTTPEQLANARENERLRRLKDQQNALARQATVSSKPSRPMADLEVIRERIASLVQNQDVTVDKVSSVDGRLRVAGHAERNADVSALLRAIDSSADDSNVELLSLVASRGRVDFELAFSPGRLSDR